MKKKKLPVWLAVAAVAAAILLNAAAVVLIFRIEGPAFLPVLVLYAVLLLCVCAWLLRRRDLQRLGAELEISEQEVLQKIREAKHPSGKKF